MKDERFKIQFFKTGIKKVIICTGEQLSSYIHALRETVGVKKFNRRYHSSAGRYVYSPPMTLDRIYQFLSEKRNTFLCFGKDRMIVGLFLMDEDNCVKFTGEKEKGVFMSDRQNNI